MNESQWVTVKTGKPAEVALAQTLLDDRGIPNRLPEEPERHFGAYAAAVNPWHLPLQVPASHAEEAQRLLAGSRAALEAEETDDAQRPRRLPRRAREQVVSSYIPRRLGVPIC